MKKSMIGAVTLAILLLISAVAFAIHSSNSRTAVRPAMVPPTLCSTPVQGTCTLFDEYDFPSIAAHSSAEISVTVSGVEFGDEVIVTPFASPEAGLLWGGYIGDVDTVKIRLVNVTDNAINPAELKYRTTVNRY